MGRSARVPFHIRARREDVDARTIADGLRTPVGVLNFPIMQHKVERVIVVSDEVRVYSARSQAARITQGRCPRRSRRTSTLKAG